MSKRRLTGLLTGRLTPPRKDLIGMRILIIDGQGGKIGRLLIEQ